MAGRYQIRKRFVESHAVTAKTTAKLKADKIVLAAIAPLAKASSPPI